MATKIKLMRLGKMRAPYYRIVVADARTKRDGRVIETIGKYHPKEDPSFIEVNSDRAQYWLGVGAQPTDPVAAIFRVTGDWQKFKGEPAPPPMKVAEPKADKAEAFAAAARASAGLSDPPAAEAGEEVERRRLKAEQGRECGDGRGRVRRRQLRAAEAAGRPRLTAAARATPADRQLPARSSRAGGCGRAPGQGHRRAP